MGRASCFTDSTDVDISTGSAGNSFPECFKPLNIVTNLSLLFRIKKCFSIKNEKKIYRKQCKQYKELHLNALMFKTSSVNNKTILLFTAILLKIRGLALKNSSVNNGNNDSHNIIYAITCFYPLYFYIFPDLKVLGFYCLHCLFGHKVHDPQVVMRKQ